MSERVTADLSPEGIARLREVAEAAVSGPFSGSDAEQFDFIDTFDPPTALALLDEVERLRAEVATAKADALREAASNPGLRLSGHSGISVRRLRDLADEAGAS